jgi:hypothetical protein
MWLKGFVNYIRLPGGTEKKPCNTSIKTASPWPGFELGTFYMQVICVTAVPTSSQNNIKLSFRIDG